MITRVLPPDENAVCEAAGLIRAGELVAFPTETVYGLGANALDENAVEKIFLAKGRPGDNPLIAHISGIDQISSLISGEILPAARRMMDAFWPGPLTMVFPKAEKVPMRVTAGLSTVAIRFPSHPVARRLIDQAGVPIAAPSANRSGRPSPTRAAHVLEDMNGKIPLILDGGACEVGLESTVLDVTGEIPRILRPGGITRQQIAAVAGAALVDPAVLNPLKPGQQVRSPGMKYRHYAPKGNLTVLGGAGAVREILNRYDRAAAAGKNPLILALESDFSSFGNRRVLSLGADARDMAERLFSALREADALGADPIFSEAVSKEGVGLAVMNRLLRAAAFQYEEV